MIKRKWFCFESPNSYTIILRYGKLTFTRVVPKNQVYHTLSAQEYMKYHIIRLNTELRDTIFPLTK